MKKFAIQIEIRDGRSQQRQITEGACSVQIRCAALHCLFPTSTHGLAISTRLVVLAILVY